MQDIDSDLTALELVKNVLDWNSPSHFSQWQAGFDDAQNRSLLNAWFKYV
jgi:hypothetical protein